jgi:hypothetical protein
VAYLTGKFDMYIIIIYFVAALPCAVNFVRGKIKPFLSLLSTFLEDEKLRVLFIGLVWTMTTWLLKTGFPNRKSSRSVLRLGGTTLATFSFSAYYPVFVGKYGCAVSVDVRQIHGEHEWSRVDAN